MDYWCLKRHDSVFPVPSDENWVPSPPKLDKTKSVKFEPRVSGIPYQRYFPQMKQEAYIDDAGYQYFGALQEISLTA